MTLRALSVKQPWCWAIASGPKRIENRSWSTAYRGQIAIHASLPWDKSGENSQVIQAEWQKLVGGGPLRRSSPGIEFGAVLAVAELVDVCTVQEDHTSCGCGSTWAAPYQCHWRLENVSPLYEPVACRGALSLWRLPGDVDAAVRAQILRRTETIKGGAS